MRDTSVRIFICRYSCDVRSFAFSTEVNSVLRNFTPFNINLILKVQEVATPFN